MGQFIYTIFVKCYAGAIRIASLWNNKARLWVQGRKGIFAEINSIPRIQDSKLIWMHCASLGEFEQGRPLLEELRDKYPGVKIVLSFFSPSGYEVMKDYKGADHVFYLPMDSAANAAKFIDAINPSLVLWVKYEYWFYYLSELKRRNITTLLVSGIFRANQPFFKWYGGIWQKMLGCFTHFFVQNEASKKLLETIHPAQNITVSGDTRFDRVIAIANNFEPLAQIEDFCGNQPVIVAGSTWEEDEVELLHFVKAHPEIKFIMAPHEIDKENLDDVKKEFPHSIFYSELGSTINFQLSTPNVLIIDNIGTLSRLYNYATITYVGGGFGADGVHNVLEAAVYGKPVIIGPVYEKYDEATGLVAAGGAISVNGLLELETALNTLLTDVAERNRAGEAARNFVYARAGASDSIIRFIQEKRLLTN